MRTIRAAAVQMHSTLNRAENVRAAERLTEQAVSAGAELVVLPELWPCLGGYEQTAAAAEAIPGDTSQKLSAIAARLDVTLLAGSIAERDSGGRVFNTSLLFGPKGDLLRSYRKIHLFDVDLPDGKSLRESDYFSSGDQVQVVDAAGALCGMSICYDLRFPELFRHQALRGAEVILMPAAFTARTGKDHWRTLVLTRAIENQAYVIAANQVGWHSENLQTWGHSMIVDPWGEVLAEAGGEGEEVIVAELSGERLASIRESFPALVHRRIRV